MSRTITLVVSLLLLGSFAVALTPSASADPVCTPYTGGGGTKSHACVDPTSSRCLYWTEGWVGSTPFYFCWVPAPGN